MPANNHDGGPTDPPSPSPSGSPAPLPAPSGPTGSPLPAWSPTGSPLPTGLPTGSSLPAWSPAGSSTAAAEHASVVRQLQEVDDAVAGIAELPVDAQVAVFTDLHQQLTAALAVTATAAGSIDESPPHRPGQSPHRGS